MAATRLHRALAGHRLVRTDFRVPRFAASDLSGQVVREVVARGKHLLLRTGAGVTLHTHFKMDGRWDLYRRGRPRRGIDHDVRVVLETRPWIAVGRKLGIVEVLPTEREPDAVGHLGPDVLGPDWDAAEATRRLGADPARPIGEALLDQRVMAGPGNVYRNEICFLRGLDPRTPIERVPDLPAVVGLMKRAMEANRRVGGQVTTGDTGRGRERWVYGRGGDPCRRCGTPIRRAGSLGGDGPERVVYWCPSCQPPVTSTSG